MDVFQQMQAVAQNEDREQQQLSFQERIVKQLLRRANIQLPVAVSKREAMQKYGQSDLDFAWFYSEFPAFPLRLFSQKLKYTQTSLADIYGKNRFKHLCWWKEYEAQVALYDVNLATDRAALCFNLPYAKEAFLMVLHNQPVQNQIIQDAEHRQDEPWPRTTFPMGKSGIVAVLESFESFMQTVGTEWADNL